MFFSVMNVSVAKDSTSHMSSSNPRSVRLSTSPMRDARGTTAGVGGGAVGMVVWAVMV